MLDEDLGFLFLFFHWVNFDISYFAYKKKSQTFTIGIYEIKILSLEDIKREYIHCILTKSSPKIQIINKAMVRKILRNFTLL